jgi:glucose-6-phosphate isomerase
MNQSYLSYWNQLKQLAEDLNKRNLKNVFAQESLRSEKFSFKLDDLFVDFSKNWIDSESISTLIKLAKSADLEAKIKSLINSDVVNYSENKSATHTQLRSSKIESSNFEDRKRMYAVAHRYSSGVWKTAFGKKVNAIVNIGIGGSYLGPKLAVEALTDLQTTNAIKVYFYSSLDDSSLTQILQQLDIESTLFCVSSKSLGTSETLINAQTIIDLLKQEPNYNPTSTNNSFVAATTNFEKASQLGIPESHVLPFSDSVGGRFSVWSSIGFPLLMAIGESQFDDFLRGAEKMDEHFSSTPYEKNVPVLMALVSIWHRNFIGLPNYAVIPYDMRLKSLTEWLQQLMMESNGKSCNIEGQEIEYLTSPAVFGGHGQLSQHAFFQALHQGNEVLPIDFIGVKQSGSKSQQFLLINMLAQSAALMQGNTDLSNRSNTCKGNRPSTTILINELTANSLGLLLAMYEHMIYVQSVIWNINCFDQPGVELGKSIAKEILLRHQQGTLTDMCLDNSTLQLINEVLND